MNSQFDLVGVLQEILNNMLQATTEFVPRIVTALVILLIGFILAKIVQKTLSTVLSRIKFDALLEKGGITESFSRIGLRDPMSVFIPKILYFLLLVFFVRTSSDVLLLHEVSNLIGAFFAFLPSVIASIMIVLLGTMLGQFAGRAVSAAAAGAGIEYAAVLGRLISAMIVLIVGILAITQLKIDMAIVHSVVLILFGGLALAFALAFGLGAREITRSIVAGLYVRRTFEVGEEIQIGTERGVLKSVTPIMTLIERDGRTVAIPNSAFVQRALPR